MRRFITYGASPRAAINMIEAGRALAFLRGREYVLPEDVIDVTPDVLRHRLSLSYEALSRVDDARRTSSPRSSAPSRRRKSRWRPMSASPKQADELLTRLEWTVIRKLDGLLQGDYRTLFRGFGLDFADLREYQAHDDVRHIDWNVTARTQVPHVRVYNEDREVTAWFLLDLSPSVDFGSGDDDQAAGADRVRRRAGAAAHPAGQPGRRASSTTASPSSSSRPATGGGTCSICSTRSSPIRGSCARRRPISAPFLKRMLSANRRRSVVFVVSDFISRPGWDEALLALTPAPRGGRGAAARSARDWRCPISA